MAKPDYAGRGIANLMSSLVRGFDGGEVGYPQLELLSGEELRGWRSVVLVVIDGLGFSYLTERGAKGALANNLAGPMTSVAPSTTTSAIPTFLTGMPPQQHGLTGWFTWFSELDRIMAVLPFVPREPGATCPGEPTPDRLVGLRPVSERMAGRCTTVMPQSIAGSVFNRAFSGSAAVRAYQDLEGFCEQIAAAVAGPGRNYVYAYWPEFDGLAHRFGIASDEVEAHFRAIQGALQGLLRRLRKQGVLLLLTADHGFVDTAQGSTVYLDAHPALTDTLERPLCGEPRFAFCYVKPDGRERFEEYVTERLGRCMLLRRSDELLERGWFGKGPPHPRLLDRIGDYALIMTGNHCIKDRVPGERPFRQVGVHGGVSDDEMYVPLVVIEC